MSAELLGWALFAGPIVAGLLVGFAWNPSATLFVLGVTIGTVALAVMMTYGLFLIGFVQ